MRCGEFPDDLSRFRTSPRPGSGSPVACVFVCLSGGVPCATGGARASVPGACSAASATVFPRGVICWQVGERELKLRTAVRILPDPWPRVYPMPSGLGPSHAERSTATAGRKVRAGKHGPCPWHLTWSMAPDFYFASISSIKTMRPSHGVGGC